MPNAVSSHPLGVRAIARAILGLLVVSAVSAAVYSVSGPLGAQAPPFSCTFFTDDPLTAGVFVKAVHIRELRSCIHELRAGRGVPPAEGDWTDPNINTGQTSAKWAHIQELRNAIGIEYAVRLRSAPGFLTAGQFTLIRADHITELREAMRLLVLPQVGAVVFTPGPGTYTSTVQVGMTSSTGGAIIRFTTDGTTPNASSPVYTGPVWLQPTITVVLTARGFANGYSPSTVTQGTYVVDPFALSPVTLTPAPGTYAIGQAVTLSADPQTVIRYTLNGSDPTEGSPVYSSPIVFNEPGTLKARAYRAGSTPSSVSGGAYQIRVPKPTITPTGGVFPTMPFVTITASATVANVVLRYTNDGSDPTESSPVYGSTFEAGTDMTVKAQAHKAGWAPSEVVSETYIHSSLTQEISSPAVVSVSNVNPAGLNAVGGGVRFDISGATFGDYVNVSRNGVPLPPSAFVLSAQSVVATGVLIDGRNDLELEATDTAGHLIVQHIVVWAGSRTLTVTVAGSSGSSLSGAVVTGTLADTGAVTMTGTTNSQGRVTFNSVPASQQVRLAASATSYRPSTMDVAPGATVASIWLDLSNNDFSQGLDGWTVLTTRAGTFQHSESSQPLVACPDCVGRTDVPEEEAVHDNGPAADDTGATGAATAQVPTDSDLAIDTKNLFGPQTVSRRFRVGSNTSRVTVRYRFQSDEIWTAVRQLGIPYQNDSYTVSLRSLTAGQQTTDTQTVGSLLNLFDANAAIPWRELSLPITQQMEEVEVTLSVANAGDNAHLSILQVDVVQDVSFPWTTFQLNQLHHRTDQFRNSRPIAPLEFLSLTQHAPSLTSYEGHTQIHGTISVFGYAPTDVIKDLRLEIYEFDNGDPRIAPLARATAIAAGGWSDVRAILLGRPVGSGIVISESTLLFEIPEATLVRFNQQTDDTEIHMQIFGTFTNGLSFHSRLSPPVNKLVQYWGGNRKWPNDPVQRDLSDCVLLPPFSEDRDRPPYPCGGDSWIRPYVRDLMSQVQDLKWNDMSKMNGGYFPPHAAHDRGHIADAWFDGYNARDGAAAARLLELLVVPVVGVDGVQRPFVEYVDRILVTYSRTASNRFWDYIKTRRIGTRCASELIRVASGHTAHFDVRFLPRGRVASSNVPASQSCQ